MKPSMEPPFDRLRSSYYAKLKQAEMQNSIPLSNEDTKRVSGSILSTPTKPVAPPKLLHSLSDEVPTVGEDEKLASTFEDPSGEGFALNYIEKVGHDIRMKFLHTLVMKGVLVPASMKPKTHQTGKRGNVSSFLVIIFDWDDTLLCTSYLNPTAVLDSSPVITELTRSYLKELEPAVVWSVCKRAYR